MKDKIWRKIPYARRILRPLLALVVGLHCTVLNAGISLSPQSQTFSKDGGTGSFTISYTGGLSYQTPKASVSWLSVKGTQLHVDSNSGTITVSYAVEPNNTSSSRSGTIYGTVSGTSFSFTVNQNPGSPVSTYVIKFNKNDGSGATASRTFTYNVKARLPLVKSDLGWTRTGYTFKGWATSVANANAGKVWREDWAVVQTPVAAGKTLNVYAVWEAGTYTIRFNKNDGSGATASRTFTYNVKARLPLLNSDLGWARAGYTFKGWATSVANADAGKVWKSDWAVVQTPVAVGKTLNVYAVWEAGTYTIRFNKNDGSGATASRTFTYNVKTRLPLVKSDLGWTLSGYTFKGWATSVANADAGKVWKSDWAVVQAPVAAGKTLNVYAIWSSNGGDTDSYDFYATVEADAGQYYYSLSGTGSLSYTSFNSSAFWLSPAGTRSSTNSGEWALDVYYNTAANTSTASRSGILTGTIFGKTVRIHITQLGSN